MKQLILIIISLLLFSCDVFKQVTTPTADVPTLPTTAKPITVYVHDTLVLRDTVNTLVYAASDAAKEAAINLRAIGVVSPDFTPEQNSFYIKQFIESYPEGTAIALYIPAGNYQFAGPIKFYRRPFHVIGDNGLAEGTKFTFPYDSDGIVYERDNTSIQDFICENIYVKGDNTNGQNKGFNMTGRHRLLFCTAKAFGYGFYAVGGVPYSDVSNSLIASCNGIENGTNYFCKGGDANIILYVNCDARDAKDYNYYSESFLGVNYFSCMAHYSGKGDWFMPFNNNARNVLYGCYSEGGSPASTLTTFTTVYGGTWGTGYKINGSGAGRGGNYLPLEGNQGELIKL